MIFAVLVHINAGKGRNGEKRCIVCMSWTIYRRYSDKVRRMLPLCPDCAIEECR